MEYYIIMKDKVAQRERTEALTGGARTFNEFVKEKASASNITPACVRSLPEIKEEWKQLKEQEKAEKKAEKTQSAEAKKAEKKALAEAKKATKKANTAVKGEKNAIKKVAKKSAVDTENIKLVLVEKAKATEPPAEPKVKGRPKKYATAEEARRAKIDKTMEGLKKKKEGLPPKAPKEPKNVSKEPRKRKYVSSFDAEVKRQLKAQEPKPPKEPKAPKRAYQKRVVEPVVTAELIAKEAKEARRRVNRAKKESFNRYTMGMEDKDAPQIWNPDVRDAELAIYRATSNKDLDEVLRLIKKVVPKNVYDKLDPVNRKSIDHTIDVYSKKREAMSSHDIQAKQNLAMMKDASDKAKIKKLLAENMKNRRGMGFNADALKEFKNYGKIQEHLGDHLNDLKETIDPKDVRDFVYFTKEKARLKSKLVGGLVRTIGGDLDSDSETDSDSDLDSLVGGMEGTNLFGVSSLKQTVINQATLPQLMAMRSELEETVDAPHLVSMIDRRIMRLNNQQLQGQLQPYQRRRLNREDEG